MRHGRGQTGRRRDGRRRRGPRSRRDSPSAAALVDAAATDVEEIAAASAGLTGLGGASLVSDQTQAALGAALKGNESLRRLGMLAGRMRRLAMGKRRSRTKAAASERSDITVGNDLARVLPHEALKLTDPLLALDFFRAFMERSLLQYELVGNERQGRGPVVVLIDDSDSMDGAPSTFAKATALALADLALTDGRACRLVRLSHRINGQLDLRPSSTDWATSRLLAFLSAQVDGGTDFEIPLRVARAAIDDEPVYWRADLVLITDGQAELSDAFLSVEASRRARGAQHLRSPHGRPPARRVARAHAQRHRTPIPRPRAPRGAALRAHDRMSRAGGRYLVAIPHCFSRRSRG